MKHFKLLIITLTVITLSACNLNNANRIERKHYAPWEKEIGYTQVIRTGNTLHLSGITSSAKSFDDQIDEIYNRLTEILSDYDTDLSHVVKEMIYTTDIEALKAASPIRKKHFANDLYPSATWVQVSALYSKEFMLEIDIIVAL
ncbi:MAG: 2-iminobutanoate/2-iminopropanoate deaminase [Flavobacteriales bacterium]|jgi:2-iminobutanoate/2-iminopropanoate deaminase